ncbi:MAG: nucleotide exchange factor GrpE [Chloroflexota bacterium]
MTEQSNQTNDGGVNMAQADPREETEASASAAMDDTYNPETLLAETRQELAAAEDKYLRLRADTENYKKRLERTSAERIDASRTDMLRKLLSVKDNLERALQYGEASQNGEGLMEGVRLTQYQLDQLLSQEGVQVIEAVGQPFDPHLEEAIQSVNDAGVPDQTVVQVVRKGYTYKDQVLRPAQVIVSVHGNSATR